MNMSAHSSQERRNDMRHSISGTKIRVRKHGLLSSPTFHECVTINFSENGLGFTCEAIGFKLLDKVDFLLELHGRQIDGQALVCHKEKSMHGTRYGLLFIHTSKNVNSLVDPEVFANLDIRMHAEKAAESVAQALGRSERAVANNRQWQQLLKAIEAFTVRVESLILENSQETALPNKEQQCEQQRLSQSLQNFLSIDNVNHRVNFKQKGLNGITQLMTISLASNPDVSNTKESAGSAEYLLGNTPHSVYGIIDSIGKAFIDLHQEERTQPD